MGASHSKQVEESKSGKRSPSQEKHVSANSTTPLATNAARITLPQTPVVEKHVSFDEKSSFGRSRTRTLSGKSHAQLSTPSDRRLNIKT